MVTRSRLKLEYKLVHGPSTTELESAVNAILEEEEDWEVHYSPVFAIYQGYPTWTQALVRYEWEEEEECTSTPDKA